MELSPDRKRLFDIIRTPYVDVLAKVSDVLDFVAAAHAGNRAALMGDAVCWWNLVPMERAHTQTARLPFTQRARAEAAEKLGGLVECRELVPDDAFEQNLSPDVVGSLVLEQLERARAHGPLVQFELFHLMVSGPYVPYVGHVAIADADPVTIDRMHEVAAAHPEELSLLEAMFQHPNTFGLLANWATELPGRMDRETARALIGYAMGRLALLTRMAMEHILGGGGMPMMIRMGDPGNDGPPGGNDGGNDPKKAN